MTMQLIYPNKQPENQISRTNYGITAYSDSRSMEEYLEFMRERLILMRELLSPCGSIYVHIDSKVGHYLKIIMDEVFGAESRVANDCIRATVKAINFLLWFLVLGALLI